MTIAAGFMVDNGLLLFADTKHSYPGAMQLESTKILYKSYPNGGESVFVLIGDVHFSKNFIQHFQSDLEGLKNAQFTQHKTRELIEDRLLKDYFSHIHRHPSPKPSADFIFGIYSPGDKRLSFYDSRATSVNQHHGYTCQGSGEYLGHFLMREKFQNIKGHKKNERAVFQIAIDGLREIRNYDDGCGRATEVVWMGANGNRSDVVRLQDDSDIETNKAWTKLSAFQT